MINGSNKFKVFVAYYLRVCHYGNSYLIARADLKTFKTQILCHASKSEVVLEHEIFDCKKCGKILSENEAHKMSQLNVTL